MLAYSSMENMGLVATAAAVGTRLAVAALLLHVLAHGVAKSLVFLSSGRHPGGPCSTRSPTSAPFSRAPLVGSAFPVGLVVLLGFPPFAMFASEWGLPERYAGASAGCSLRCSSSWRLPSRPSSARDPR